ncbi:MAG: exo-alpha-sialidase [Phascolarctobacterium sp.]
MNKNFALHKELIMAELPTAFCHASTVVKLRNGGLMCCWFGGSHEGEADVAIYASRKMNISQEIEVNDLAKRDESEALEAGKGWSEPVKLANGADANWNPVLFFREDGTLLLFYKEGQRIAEWRTMFMTSSDDGKTWSAPRELVTGDVSGGRGPVRNKLIRLASGRVLAGGSTEHGIWRAFADISDDDARTWHKSAPVVIENLQYQAGEKTAESSIAVSAQSFYGRGVIQPSLWQSADGSVHMLLRSSEGFVHRADSTDEGESWSAAYPLTLPNNNSGLDLVALADGRLLLVCNPVAANWGMRSPLSLFMSEDDGHTWHKLIDLETEKGEFSYPAIIAEDHDVYISYTYDRKNIAVVQIKI